MEQNNPLANQVKPDAPVSPQMSPDGNPLGKIAPALMQGAQQQQQMQPAPTAAQTTAAVHRFNEIQNAMRKVMEDKNFGRSNIRPKLLDAASKLLGAKILSLPEIMNSIKDIPDDPIKQKAFVQNIFNSAKQSELNVLEHHSAAVQAGIIPPDGGDPYDDEKHSDHIDGLMQHYKRESNG